MHTQLRTFLKQTSALTSIATIGLLLTQPVLANPLGGDVVSGAATISTPDPSTTLINQSTDRAVINWDSFDIDEGELTQFDLPSANSWTLNRVVGSQSPSSIQGAIISNGNIVIVNPDGIHFGPGSTVDVNRLIASTADITNDNFIAGQLDFGIAGNPSASIVNEGEISAADYGLAALVAPSERNSGVIMARLGTVGLSAGNSFTIDPYGDGLIKLAIGDEIAGEVFDIATGEAVSDLVLNDGTLSANGGTVAMTAATARQAVNSVVNNTGIVEARSVGMQNGMIVLGGSTGATKPVEAPIQVVRVSGTLDASGTNELYPLGTPVTGGAIEVTGEAIIASGANIDASGTDGGGTILVGGDYLGGNIEAQEALALGVVLEERAIETAMFVALDESVSLTADAVQNGDGGKIIVWSDRITSTSAAITARGGAAAGNGGFIETSGSYLDLRNSADASAINGEVGTWLVDPYDIAIASSESGTQNIIPQEIFFATDFLDPGSLISSDGSVIIPTSSGSVLDVIVIEDALNSGTSVVVSTVGVSGGGAGNISLEANIDKTSGGDAVLVLNAAGGISIGNVDVVSSSGTLWMSLEAANGDIIGTNVGEIDLNGGGLSLAASGDISINSLSDMPNIAISFGNNVSGTSDIALNFDGDRVRMSRGGQVVLIPDFGIRLVDGTASGQLLLDLGENNDLTLYNNAITDLFGRIVVIDIDNALAVVEEDHLDGVPEIIYGQDFNNLLSGVDPDVGYEFIPFSEPRRSSDIATVETSLDGNDTVNFYSATAPSGVPILEAYLDSLATPVEPPSPPNEGVPAEIEQVLLEPSTNEPVVFQQYDEPIGPIQPTELESLASGSLTWAEQSDFQGLINGLAVAKTLKGYYGTGKEIVELILKFDDARKAAAFITKHMSLSTGLSDAERIFIDKASVSIYKSSVSILAELFLESMLEGFFVEQWGVSDLEAESYTATTLNLATANLTGQILDQSMLILEASLRLQESNSDLLKVTLDGTQRTIDALDAGALSPETAAQQFDFTLELASDYIGFVSAPSSREAAQKMWIMAHLGKMKVEEGPLGISRLDSDMRYLQRLVIDMDRGNGGSGDLIQFMEQAAISFNVQSWVPTPPLLEQTLSVGEVYQLSDLRKPGGVP